MNNLKAATVVLLLQINFSLSATEFCATTAEELRSALDTAENNAAHDVIKIAEGSYITNGTAFTYVENLGWDLQISGGWTESFGNPCGLQLGNNPYATTLDGDSVNSVLRIQQSGNADLLVANIAFINGYAEVGSGAGLKVVHNNESFAGTVVVENNIFINNVTGVGSAMYLFGADKIYVRNNLIYANHAINGNSITIIQDDGYGVYFTNNTVVFNTAEVGGRSGVYVSVNNSSQALIANNVLKDNVLSDLFLFGDGDVYLKNNDLGTSVWQFSPIEIQNNINLPPRFESGLLNFTPAAASPLVNAGVKPCSTCPIPIPFDEAWILGATDLAGNVRSQNGKVDIGAFESSHNNDLIFWGTFGD